MSGYVDIPDLKDPFSQPSTAPLVPPYAAAGGNPPVDASGQAFLNSVPKSVSEAFGNPKAPYDALMEKSAAVPSGMGTWAKGAGIVALLSLLGGRKSGYAGVGAPLQAWNQGYLPANEKRIAGEKAGYKDQAAPYLSLMNEANKTSRELMTEKMKGDIRLQAGTSKRNEAGYTPGTLEKDTEYFAELWGITNREQKADIAKQLNANDTYKALAAMGPDMLARIGITPDKLGITDPRTKKKSGDGGVIKYDKQGNRIQ